ncbi:hypothetical protein KR059_008230 [Drosophila kikkawai]|nr:hypothetical protein KR059_008230 [Drosophila kikkawai]
MGSQRFCLLVQFLGLFLAPARGQMFFWNEDDYVDVDFRDCVECEQNYRNFVFILKNSETEEASMYPYVACIMWLILATLVIRQRWRQIKYKL